MFRDGFASGKIFIFHVSFFFFKVKIQTLLIFIEEININYLFEISISLRQKKKKRKKIRSHLRDIMSLMNTFVLIATRVESLEFIDLIVFFTWLL